MLGYKNKKRTELFHFVPLKRHKKVLNKKCSTGSCELKAECIQCFSMQVVINKCFLLNPEKNWHRSILSSSKNAKSAHFNSENDVTKPKARLL